MAIKPSTKTTPTKSKAGVSNPDPVVTVRLYRHGLGDCFLLRIAKDGGSGTFNILIDCGLISVAKNASTRMTAVARDIAEACSGHVDVVVMTHEHWDHASAFSPQQAKAVFDDMTFGEAWYAWTEDPKNALGTKLREERQAKIAALAQAVVGLKALGVEQKTARAGLLAKTLQFFGLSEADLQAAVDDKSPREKLGKSRVAFDYFKNRSDVKVRYLTPGGRPIGLKGASAVRVFALGPPQDEGMIKRSSPTKTGKEVYEFADDLNMSDSLGAAFERLRLDHDSSADRDCPFDSSLALGRSERSRSHSSINLERLKERTWDAQDQAWRKIDSDWMDAAETLALNLDSHTNNTCLALGFEIAATGDVLLFAADAQVGNWLSWQNVTWSVPTDAGPQRITGPDLLSRTVFYKVGHHGSHNATLRTFGLEQMTSDDLVAFVPVVRQEAEKNRWMQMPFTPLIQRLQEKTNGRLIMSDDQQPPTESSLSKLRPRERTAFLRALNSKNPLYYEYSIFSSGA